MKLGTREKLFKEVTAKDVRIDVEEDFEIWKKRVLYAVFMFVIPERIYGENSAGEVVETERDRLWDAIVAIENLWYQVFIDWMRSLVNYERAETFGDTISGFMVMKILFENYESLTDAQLSNLKAHYVTNKVQGNILRQLTDKIPDDNVDILKGEVDLVPGRLSDLILYDNTIVEDKDLETYKGKNDLYEAILTAIFYTGNKMAPALGYLLCERFAEYNYTVYEKINIEKHSVGNPINVLSTLFTRFGYPDRIPKPKVHADLPKEERRRDRSTTRTVVTLGIGPYSFLVNEVLPKILEDPTLTIEEKRRIKTNYSKLSPYLPFEEVVGLTKKEAKEEVTSRAVEKLDKELRFNEAWASWYKEIYDGVRINQQYSIEIGASRISLYDALLQKLHDDGFSSFATETVSDYNIIGNRTVIRLIGTRRDGTKELLVSFVGQGDPFKTKAEIMAKYIGGNLVPR